MSDKSKRIMVPTPKPDGTHSAPPPKFPRPPINPNPAPTGAPNGGGGNK